MVMNEAKVTTVITNTKKKKQKQTLNTGTAHCSDHTLFGPLDRLTNARCSDGLLFQQCKTYESDAQIGHTICSCLISFHSFWH